MFLVVLCILILIMRINFKPSNVNVYHWFTWVGDIIYIFYLYVTVIRVFNNLVAILIVIYLNINQQSYKASSVEVFT